MAVKARGSLTLTSVSDGATGKGILNTEVTYQSSSSGTTVPTGTWTSSPSSTSASMPYLWTRTVINYTDETSSTSYTIGSTLEGIEVGGRNLLKQYIGGGHLTTTTDDPTITIQTGTSNAYFYLQGCSTLYADTLYTLSCDASNVPEGYDCVFAIGDSSSFYLHINSNGKCSATGTFDYNIYDYTRCRVSEVSGVLDETISITLSNFKLEKGNTATDWTPAPEDVEENIDDASKVATDYMGFDSDGLQIGKKKNGSWTSYFRAQITSSAFNILNKAGQVVASYGEKLIELGKNTTEAIISLCGGKAEIRYDDDDDTLAFSGPRIRFRGTEKTSVENQYINEDELVNVETKINLAGDGMVVNTQGFAGYSESSGWINPVEAVLSFNHDHFSVYYNEYILYANQNGLKLGYITHPINMHAMSVYGSVSLSLSTSVQKVVCGNSLVKHTNLLEASADGGIKCLQDGYVLVFGFAYAKDLTSGDTIGLSVYNNSTPSGSVRIASSSSAVSGNLPVRIVPVSAGDVIYMYAQNYSGARGLISASRSTSMTVMYIG